MKHTLFLTLLLAAAAIATPVRAASDDIILLGGSARQASDQNDLAKIHAKLNLDGTYSLYVIIESGSISVAGVSTAALQALANTKLDSLITNTAVQLGGGAITSSTQRVTLATDGPGILNLGTIATNTTKDGFTFATGVTATNAAATITYAAPGSGVSTVLQGTIYCGYATAPTAGTLTIACGGSSQTIPITAAGPLFYRLERTVFTANTAVTITLSAGGSGVVGYLNPPARTTQ